jgi:hypothetical protein
MGFDIRILSFLSRKNGLPRGLPRNNHVPYARYIKYMQLVISRWSKETNAAHNIFVIIKTLIIGIAGFLLIQFGPQTNMFLTVGFGAFCMILCIVIIGYILLHWNDGVNEEQIRSSYSNELSQEEKSLENKKIVDKERGEKIPMVLDILEREKVQEIKRTEEYHRLMRLSSEQLKTLYE